MPCSNCGAKNKAARKHIKLQYAGDAVVAQGGKCPIDGSRLKLVRRPRSHWRCVRNNHKWRVESD